MPDLEVSIPYKHPALSFARFLVILFFPVWGVLAPLQILIAVLTACFVVPLGILEGGLTAFRFFSPMNLLLITSAIGGAALNCTLLYLGMRSVVVLGDKTITLNEKGISFPANFLPGLKFKRHRKWSELGRLEAGSDSKLQFKFISGGTAEIKLDSFSPEQKEKLLLGLNVWAKNQECQNQIAGLLESMHNTAGSGKSQSYTALWEEQMNRHFSSTAFVPLAQGATLQSGRIKVIGPIAFGGLSAVYLAQLNSTESVILKELVTDDANPELKQKSQEMFTREAEILMKLRHPNIARVLDHFTETGRSYLLLEYIQGENLRNIITQSGPRSEAQSIDWARQTAEILSYIHEQEPPIIHRDLTPDNLVLRDGRQIMLIDFGAANTFLGTATGTLVGKQSYISPEQFRGKPVIQSDIYSLGASLYFLLTGEDPEPLSQSYPRSANENISEPVNQLVADCTNFAPSQRPKSARELAERLAELSANSSRKTNDV